MTVEEFFREKEEFHQSEEFLWQCSVCVCVCVCVCECVGSESAVMAFS